MAGSETVVGIGDEVWGVEAESKSELIWFCAKSVSVFAVSAALATISWTVLELIALVTVSWIVSVF